MTQPADYYRSLLDAVPLPVLVVDADVRIADANAAAARLLAVEPAEILRKRGGEALHCIHATDVPEGCGQGPACSDCVIRGSVNASFAGNAVVRRHANAEWVVGGESTRVDLLVTAAPFAYDGRQMALLILEDVSELHALRGIVPICAKCKKMRDDANYWRSVEGYLGRHFGVDVSHGLCPSCADELYPDLHLNEPE
jgi:PAS domain-containing protein